MLLMLVAPRKALMPVNIKHVIWHGPTNPWTLYTKELMMILWLISTNKDRFRFRLRFGFLYYADISTGSDSDSDPLIQMYGIGIEICPWDGDLSLKWVQ